MLNIIKMKWLIVPHILIFILFAIPLHAAPPTAPVLNLANGGEITGNLTVTGGDLILDATTNANQEGIIYKGANLFLHEFEYGDNGTVTPSGNNLFLGENSGNLTTGSTAISVTESSYNVGTGFETLTSITTGYRNTANGGKALILTTTGLGNTAVGYSALRLNTTNAYSTAVGYQSLEKSTATGNTGVGRDTLGGITTGGTNSAVGYRAGQFITGGSVSNVTGSASVFLGADTRAAANAEANQIVIGAVATGIGANSAVLGNSSVTKTILRGTVNITGGTLIQEYTVTVDNTDGVDTYLAAQLLGKLIRRGTGDEITGAVIDVTDTAANIVAAIPNCQVGSGIEFTVNNEDSTHTLQVDGGTDVTMSPNDPSTVIPANSSGRFLVEVTNATAASEAVTVHMVGVEPILSKSITVESPIATEDITIFFNTEAINIYQIEGVLIGSDTPSVTVNIVHHTDRSNAGNDVCAADRAVTSVTTGDTLTLGGDTTIPAESFVWLETSAQSGTVTELNLTILYGRD